MIDSQSSAVVRSSRHRPCYSLPDAPAPGEGRDEGGLNSRTPARADQVLSARYARTSQGLSFQAYPRLPLNLPRLAKLAASFFQGYPRLLRTFSKVIQACPRLAKVILEKKRLFISCAPKPGKPVRINPINPPGLKFKQIQADSTKK